MDSTKELHVPPGERTEPTHVIWDWNGTLLDDVNATYHAFAASVEMIGIAPPRLSNYRRLITQPVRDFYDRLLGSPLTDDEWKQASSTFDEIYALEAPQATLTEDAKDALDRVRRAGMTQSILSMHPHSDVVARTLELGVSAYMNRIDGLLERSRTTKEVGLRDHIQWLVDETKNHVNAQASVLIGDTLDDAIASQAAEIRCVLYSEGVQHTDRLRSANQPIVRSLTEAVALIGVP